MAYDERLIGIVETARSGRRTSSLILYAGHPPTARAVEDLGYACTGHFWRGIALRLIESGRASEVDRLEAEPGALLAGGDREQLISLAEALMPYLTDAAALTALVHRAEPAELTARAD